ncbi:CD225/dispanin family protein [Streptomyces scabiei]|uniref:CD225/dispanin family protein n=1 Tax=Streptomyces scabiei TaxID=1930 RepID=UPI00298FE022|nr:CD225/dispanin family protein [Streptomyces scabiei]MDW8804991.1 CD225/dispanin family protein [Streptomyces scabiei]
MADKHRVPPPDDEDWGDRTGWQDSSFSTHAEPPSQPPRGPVPESYMTPAILVTLLCFLPTGIAAIVFASQVSAKAAAGDYPGSVQASRRARILILVSVGIGVLFWLIIIIAIGASDTSNEYMPVP